ncbi:hypothetical protein BG011_001947 [Mortierella polycephala]|uniref:Peptidase A1 domain-containing protein n=1 Tax=Mortierella polycephala TaxID=41804 RepID=A0A9P6Q4B4_9FUNG|nr:hypothetical protein BG011_001947 [Mortierella polycephala]
MQAMTILRAAVLFLCLYSTTAEISTLPATTPELPHPADVFNLYSNNVIRLRLDRKALSRSHLETRSRLKPYSLGESGAVVTQEPFVDVPLTSIPKEYGYTATFSIGSYLPSSPMAQDQPELVNHGQVFNLLVDTGSDLVVVTSAGCNDPECEKIPHRFNCSASLTCAPTHNLLTGSMRWVQRYGDGTRANGTLVQDTLRFTSGHPQLTQSATSSSILQISNQPILVVDEPGLRLFKSYGSGVDGIIGMNVGSPVIAQTVIQNLQNAEASSHFHSASFRPAYPAVNDLSIQDSTSIGMGFMSLWLGHSLEPGQGGELLLNAIDHSRFQGSIHWTDRGPSPHDWSVLLDRGLMVCDTVDGLARKVSGTHQTFAVIDSGSDGIYLQRTIYNALFQQISGAIRLEGGHWRVPCEGATELVFGIQGKLYRIPYQDWVKKKPAASTTRGGKVGRGGYEAVDDEEEEDGGTEMCSCKVYGSSPGPILLGATFLRSVYTVFDFSLPGYERIGFAALA